MKIALIQQSKTADIAKNKQDLARGIADAASKGAELVVLQELHNSLYFCQVESTDNFDLASRSFLSVSCFSSSAFFFAAKASSAFSHSSFVS